LCNEKSGNPDERQDPYGEKCAKTYEEVKLNLELNR
jgi:hypothetical protein